MPGYEGLIKYPVAADKYNTAYGEPNWWKDLASTANAAISTKADVGHTHSSLSSGAFTFNVSSSGALAANAGGANTLQFDMNTGRMIAGDIPWARISGAPATTQTAWADVTGKPSTFTPTAHTHPQSDVAGLASALDGKVGASDPRLSDARTPKPHEHTGVSQPGFSVDISTAGAFAGRSSGTNTFQFDLNTGRMVAGIVPWARITDVPTWDAAIAALNAAAA